ncbi:uncharacterized protein CLUP02_05086 [Colletotrichum lupini]|uniref:Uncharacterized protein n=1 Tax=Colletotrichum lupini TaxID=145971 RepID=A0A9Q8SLK5_9PEZI|nr:uncharacterized protein CLUP02_05086 [Colletotrichum lupini]UQC79606.1 hypothetical protein CLUP02_05086 [Colletotrichum lupini]
MLSDDTVRMPSRVKSNCLIRTGSLQSAKAADFGFKTAIWFVELNILGNFNHENDQGSKPYNRLRAEVASRERQDLRAAYQPLWLSATMLTRKTNRQSGESGESGARVPRINTRHLFEDISSATLHLLNRASNHICTHD